MPIVIKNRRSATTGAPWPTDLQPGQVAVNTGDLQLAVGDADGPDGAAPAIPVIAIRLFYEGTSYVVDDMVVYEGDIYTANAPHLGPWDEGNFDPITPPQPPADTLWPLELEDNRVGYTWNLDAADGLVLNRNPDANLVFITNTNAGFQIGDGTNDRRAEINWNDPGAEIQFRAGSVPSLAVGDGYVTNGVQIRVPDLVNPTQDIGGYRLDVDSASHAIYRKATGDSRVRFRSFEDELWSAGENGIFIDGDVRVQLRVPVGSVNAPSFGYFDSGVWIGAYSNAANEFSFSANGEDVFKVDQTDTKVVAYKPWVIEGDNRIYFPSTGDVHVFLRSSYAELAWDNAITEFGDPFGDGLHFKGQEGHGIVCIRNNNVIPMSTSIYGTTNTTSGVTQVLNSVQVGVENPPNIGAHPNQPKFVHMASDVGRSYTISNETEIVLERNGDCYLSIITDAIPGDAGVKLGNAVTEDAFGIVTPASQTLAFQEEGTDLLRVTPSATFMGALEVLGEIYADSYVLAEVPPALAELINELQLLDARITTAGG